jgi:hypothetical protein
MIRTCDATYFLLKLLKTPPEPRPKRERGKGKSTTNIRPKRASK